MKKENTDDEIKYHPGKCDCDICIAYEKGMKKGKSQQKKEFIEMIDKPYGIDKLNISKNEKINLAMFLISYKQELKKQLESK